jgi:hypothetical protein
LEEIFRRAGVAITPENRRDVDRAIHSMVGVKYKDCPGAWREVKKRIAQNEESFISDLRKALRLK